MEPQKVYKVVRQHSDGRLTSVYAGQPETMTEKWKRLTPVEYKVGEIAYAPQGQMGLAAFTTLNDAVWFARHEGALPHNNLILSATPLGPRGPSLTNLTGRSSYTYPALLIGEQVWPEQPAEPEWKDVTAECILSWWQTERGVIRVSHDGYTMALIGHQINCSKIGKPDCYRVETLPSVIEGFSGTIKVLKRKG